MLTMLLLLLHSPAFAHGPSYGTAAKPSQQRKAPGLTAEQHNRADQLISVFENSDPQIHYEYIENLHDGRGYTAGRAGFCTGTGDLVVVAKQYVKEFPGDENKMAPYLPELIRLAEAESEATDKLQGFPHAWKTAAKHPLFRQVQDRVTDQLYYRPAMKRAEKIGAQYPLTLAALYEAVIQHGNGNGPDGLGGLIQRATQESHGTPLEGVAEEVWLKNFLEERRADLLDPTNQETREEWRESVGRADEMLRIFQSRNFDFHGPLQVKPFEESFTLP